MSSEALDLCLRQVFGTPADGATKVINTSTGATVTSTSLTANAVYRLVCSEDAYVHFDTSNGATVTSTDMLMIGGVPECFSTDDEYVFISAIRRTTTGKLWITRLTR